MKAAGRTMTVVEMLDVLAGAHPLTPVWIGEGDPVVSVELSTAGVRLESNADHISTDDVAELLQSIRAYTKSSNIFALTDDFCSEWGIEL
jgi:hypothetical protein